MFDFGLSKRRAQANRTGVKASRRAKQETGLLAGLVSAGRVLPGYMKKVGVGL